MLYLLGPTHGSRSQHVVFGKFLKASGIEYRNIRKHEELFDIKIGDQDIFLCGVPVDQYESNIETIKFLKSKKSRVFFLLDHWHNSYKNFYDTDSRKFFLPEKIFCIDAFMKKELVSGGIDAGTIQALGHPALEDTFNKKIDKKACEKIKRTHGIHGKVLTLYLDPIPRSRKIEIGYCDTEVVDLVCRSFHNFAKDYTLIIKCHPRTEIEKIQDTVSKFGVGKILISSNLKNIDDNQILNISDKVAGMTSIMLAHALVLDKPTRSIQIAPTASGKKRSNYILDMIKIDSIGEVDSFFQIENFKKNTIDPCIFTSACSKIYHAMDI
jgi:hypothetical protein